MIEMELLLRRDVKGLGRMGEVVRVTNGYARNYLLPRKLAVPVTPANLKDMERAAEARRRREAEEVQSASELAKRLSGFLCLIEARCNEVGHLFGSVGPEQVAQVLVSSGFEMIRPTNINMVRRIDQVGDHTVEVIVHPEVRVNVTVRVVPKFEGEKAEA
jgi:large subunit ribosomal protein L9